MEQTGKNNFNKSETLLSAREAAQKLSCAPDYVSKLCREGKLDAVRENNAWFIAPEAIEKFKQLRETARIERSEKLSTLRRKESESYKAEKNTSQAAIPFPDISKENKAISPFSRLGLTAGSSLLFAAILFGSIGGAFSNSFSHSHMGSTSASVASATSPFFGNNPFAFLASLFAPKSTSVVATATSTDTATNSGVAENQNSSAAATSTPTQQIVQNNTYPVIERTVEHTTTVSGITEAEVDAKLSMLDNSIRTLLFSTINSLPNSLPSSGGVTNNIALSQRIDHLDGTTLNNVTVNGISGLTDADIPDNLTINTSSFTATATSTLAGIQLTGIDCSVYNNGGKLTTDALGNVICDNDFGSSGVGSPGGNNTTVQYNDGGNFGGSASFAFNKTSGVLTVPQLLLTGSTTLNDVTANNATTSNATTTNLFASNAKINSIVLGSLSGALQAVNGVVSATSTLSVAFGGTGLSSIPSYGQVLVGNSAGGYTLTSTSSLGIASAVWGNITGSISNQTDLQNELNLRLSTSSLNSIDKGYFFSTTSANYFLAQANVTGFSTTSADYWKSVNDFFSTTSANAFIIASSSIPHIPGAALGDVLYWTGSSWGVRATSTLGLGGSGGGSVTSVDASGGTTGLTFTGGPVTTSGTLTLSGTLAVANGGTGSTTLGGILKGNGTGSVQTAIAGVDYLANTSGDWTGTFDGQEGVYYLANSFSTSSAQYFLSLNQGLAFSTTSADYWKSVNDFFSTTSASYFLSQNQSNAFSTSSAIFFANASTTIAKTYTANTFGAAQTFTGGITIGSLTGPLSANNGVVSATSSIGVLYGGTGLTAAPSYGQILVGNSSGGYTLTATSSLGLSSSYSDWRIQNGYLTPTTTIGIVVNASSTIGGGIGSGLTVVGGATTSGNLAVQGTGTSSIAGNLSVGGLTLVNGNIVPTVTNTYGLGQPGLTFKDIYIGPNSLYVNGQKVLSTDGSSDVVVSADVDQNLKLKTTGVGNVEINPSGTGQVLLKSSINVTAGKSITTSDLSALPIPNGATLGNVKITGHTIGVSDTNGSVFITPDGSGGTYITVGNVGIGSTTPATTFSVSGSGYFTSGLGIGTVNTTAGTLVTTGNASIGGTLKLSTVTSCTGGQALQTDGSGNVSCGSISVSGNSSAGGWTTNNVGRVTLSTTTDLVAVGATTTPYAKLAVLSGSTATTTFALLPASAQTANIIDIYNTSGVLSSVLTAGGSFGLGTTSPSATLAVQGNEFVSGNITGANLTATGTVTTSNLNVGSLTGVFYGTNGSVGTIATSALGLLSSTSIQAQAPLSFNSSTGALSITQSGPALDGYLSSTDFNSFNSRLSTSTLGLFDKGYFFSTTSTDYWKTQNNLFSTTSANYFADSSTTIAKTYAANTFAGAQTFNGGVTIGTFNGLVAANNGVTYQVSTSTNFVTSLIAGNGISISSNTGAVTVINTIGYEFPGNATSTSIAFNGGLTATNADVTTLTAGNILATGSTTLQNFTANNSTTTNATTTNFAITGISGSLLKTLANGAVVAAQAGTDYLTNAYVFAWPFTPVSYGNATSTTIGFLGGLVSVGSTTVNGDLNITGSATIGTLSGLLYGTNGSVGTVATNTLGLLGSSSLSAVAPLSYNANTGTFSITQAGLATNGYLSSTDFTTFNNKISSTSLSGGTGISYNSGTGVITNTIGYEFPNNATSTSIAFNGGLTTTNSTSTNATTTNLAITGISGQLLKTTSAGAVVAAIQGIDYVTNAQLFAYPFPSSATSSPIAFNGGLTTTGATSTGTFAVTGSTTLASLLNVGGALNANGSLTVAGNTTLANATSTSLAITGLVSGAGQCLTVDLSGNVTTQSCSLGAATPFVFLPNFGTQTAATSTPIWAQSAIFASSTSRFAGINTISATTTNLLSTGSSTIAGILNATGGIIGGASTLSSLTLGTQLSVSSGGTGLTSAPAYGALLGGNGTGGYTPFATSSLAINFADLVGSATDAQVSNTLTITGGSIDGAPIGASTPSTGVFTNSTSTNATTTNLYINGTIAGVGLTSCSTSVDKLLWNSVTRQFICGTDQGGGGSGSDTNFTFFNGSGIRLATSSNQVLLGNATHTSTSTLSKLEVWGGATIDSVVATEATTTSLYASGQAVIGGRLGIGTSSPSANLAIVGGNVIQVASGSPALATAIVIGGETYTAYVVGNIAYVAAGSAGLKILSINDQTNPIVLGTYASGIGSARSVIVAGKYAYVADSGNGITIIDVSNPASPSLAGSYTVGSGSAYSLALSGRYLYVLNFNGKSVAILDIGNPANPTLASTYSLGGGAGATPIALAVSGKYLYIASYEPRLRVVDVSDPVHPTAVSTTYSTNLDTPTSMYVSGSYLYLTDQVKGLQVINIKNPASPTSAGSYNPGGINSFGDVKVAGQYAYVTDRNNTNFLVLDVKNPASPTLVGTYALANSPSGIFVAGKYAYVGDESTNFDIIDINGALLPSATIGSIAAGNVNVSENINAGGDLYVGGGINAGLSGIFTRGGLTVLGTSSLQAVTSTFATTTNATTTTFAITGTTGALLKTLASGAVVSAIAGTDYANFAYPFLNNATSTTLAFNAGLLSVGSTTINGNLNIIGNSTTTNATTTNLAITSISGQLLKTLSSGAVVAAVAGTDYALPSAISSAFPFTPTTFGSSASNATSTLIGFNTGLYALASSTIGGGTQASGLTILGGATTTGNSYIAGSLLIGTTSPDWGAITVDHAQDQTTGVAVSNFNNTSNAYAEFSANTSAGSLAIGLGTGINSGAYIWNTANSGIDFAANNTLYARLNNKGNFGLGTTSPVARLTVAATSSASNIPLFTLQGPTPAGFATSTLFQVAANGSTTLYQIPSSLLKTNSNGVIVAAVAGTDYATPSQIASAFPFTPTTYGNATSTTIGFNAGLLSIGSTTINGSATTTGSQYIGGDLSVAGNINFGDFHVDATPTCGSTYHTFIGDVGTVGGDECAALNVTQEDINGNIIYRFGEANGTWAGEFYANASSVNLNTKTVVPITFQIQQAEKFRVDSTGNIGLATSSPSQELSVQGGALISGNLFVGGSLTSTSTITGTNLISTGSTTISGAFNSLASNILASTTLIGSTLLSNATTSTFAISSVSGALLKTLASGAVVAAQSGVDYVTGAQLSAAFPFTPGASTFGLATNSTSTAILFTNSISASSTSHFAGISTLSATTTVLSVTGSSTITGQLNAVGGATLGSVTAGATNVSSLTVGSLSGVLYGTNGSVGTIATSALGLLASTSIQAQAPLSFNTSTGALSISQSGTASNGYLSSTDFNTFNNKISSTSLSGGAGISYNSATGVITNTIGYSFPNNATSTTIGFTGGLISAASTTIVDNYASLQVSASGGSVLNWNGYQLVLASNSYLSLGGASPYVESSDPGSVLQVRGDDGVALVTNSAERVRVDSNGNFGVGTTTPTQRLSVQGGALISGNLSAANITATGTLSVGSLTGLLYGTNGSVGTIATNTLGLLASSSLSATAPLSYNTATGNFSITQSGASTDGYLSSTDWNSFNNRLSTSSVALLGYSTSGYPFPLTGNATSTLTQFNGGLTAYASSTIGNGTQAGGLAINGGATTTGNAYIAGTLGVGTTTPGVGSKFGVNGNSYLGGDVFIPANQYLNIGPTQLYYNSTFKNVAFLNNQSGGGLQFQADSYIQFQRSSDFASLLSIYPSNRIALFDGLGNETNGVLQINGTTTAAGGLRYTQIQQTTAGYLNFTGQDANVKGVTFNSGFVGIGTSTPNGSLVISKDAQENNTDALDITAATVPTKKIQFGIDNNSNYGYINTLNWGISNTNVPLILNQTGGKVGVGTTNPTATLDVNGTASSTNLVVSGVPGQLLKTLSSGAVVAAVADTDYATPSAVAAAFPFTPATNYAVNTSATSTPIWARLGLFASSTSNFDQINVGSSTSSTLATSTFFGNAVVRGNASTTALTISKLAAGGLGIDSAGHVYSGATSTLSTISGTLALSQLATQAANTVVGNLTGGSAAPTAISTSSLFAGTPGQVLTRLGNGTWVGVATTTNSCSSGITCSYAGTTWSFTNSGVTSLTAGNGIALSAATGAVTVTNTIGYPFLNNATSTTLTFSGGLISASSTLGNFTGLNATTTNATTTTFAISNISNSLLKTLSNGAVVAAVAGTDYSNFAYPFAGTGNSTSTLTQFNGGLTAYASSTIGNGTQAGGLTISGGATTTGGIVHIIGNNSLNSNADVLTLVNSGSISNTAGTAFYNDSGNNIGLRLRDTNGTSVRTSLGVNTNTYFANLTSANVGIGTSSPWAKLSVANYTGDTATTLFAISSSTASATSTLFKIDNTGSITATSSFGDVLSFAVKSASPTGTNGFGFKGNQGGYFEVDSDGTFNFGNNNTNTYFAGDAQGTLQLYSSGADTVTLDIASSGFGTTTLSGLRINGQATSTSNVGFNITAGCYAVRGVCLPTSFTDTIGNWFTPTTNFGVNTNATSTPISFFAGINASSTSRFENLSVNGTLNFATTSANASSTLISFGSQTLFVASSTGSNTGIGLDALGHITRGSENTAFGYQALSTATSSRYNTAVGSFTLSSNTSGEANAAFGDYSLSSNVSGGGNTALGYSALESSASGDYNTAVGYQTLDGTNGGSYNVALGYAAGWNISSGSHNIVIGTNNNQVPIATGDYQLNIGNLIYGSNVDGSYATLSSGNIGIGTTTPGSRLSVQGDALVSGTTTAGNLVATSTLTVRGLSGSAGQCLTTNANGLVIAQSCSTGSAGFPFTPTTNFGVNTNATSTPISFFGGINASSTSRFENVSVNGTLNFATTSTTTLLALTNQAFLSASLSRNFLGLGFDVGTSTTGNSYTNFIGYQAGWGAKNAGDSNFIGETAGYLATGASYANFIGYAAGSGAANAIESNFIGDSAGDTATNASYSNFLGYSAGRNATFAYDSNFIGLNAGFGASAASTSNFIGDSAGYQAVNASDAIFLGTLAGYQDTVDNTSNFGTSIAIGRYSGTGGFSNSIALGHGVINSAATQLNIGNVLYATGIYNSDTQSSAAGINGKFGVSTSTPFAKLSVHANNGDTNQTLFAIGSSTQSSTSTLFSIDNKGALTANSSSASFTFASTTGIRFTGTNDGYLSISPSGTFYVGSYGGSRSSLSFDADSGQIQSYSSALGFDNFDVSATGFGTTTLRGLTINGQATSTSNVGFNITAGCYAVRGACLPTSFTDTVGAWFTPTNNFGVNTNATSTPISFFSGLNASSTSRFENLSVNGTLNFSTTSTTTLLAILNQPYFTFSPDSYLTTIGFGAGTSSTAYDSFFVGANAGWGSGNAQDSNFIGPNAGYLANASNSNFFGASAGDSAINASYSNFFGNSAGHQATNANDSNFLGHGAGDSATNAHNSNFLGYNAGYQATDANDSAFIGTNAGNGATNASYSVFAGFEAGQGSPNATESIFIGNDAGYFDTVDNTLNGGTSIAIGKNSGTGGFSDSIAIGHSVMNSTSSQLNIGNVLYATGIYKGFTQLSTPTAQGKLGVGTTTPATTLSVQGDALVSGTTTSGNLYATSTLTIKPLGASAGQCLTTNANGLVIAQSCGGASATFPFAPATGWGNPTNATSTLIGFTNGIYSLASSTIGNGTQAGGLTISGGATTTGNAYFVGNVGIGTTSPNSALEVNGTVRATSFASSQFGSGAVSFTSTQLLLTAPGGASLVWNGSQLAPGTDAARDLGGTTNRFRDLYLSGTASSTNFLGTNATTTNATTTNLAITGISSSLLKTLSSGAVVAAVAGTDYQAAGNVGNWFTPTTYGNATSTTIGFNAGLISVGSTTLNGNATTTGIFAASGITSFGTGAGTFAITAGGDGRNLELRASDAIDEFFGGNVDIYAGDYGGQNGGGSINIHPGSSDISSTMGDFNVYDGSDQFAFGVKGGTGNVGIGTTTPRANFAVQGNALISGTTTAGNLFATSTLTVKGLSGSAGQCLTVNGNGLVIAQSCSTGSAGFPFTPATNFGTAANSTTTTIWFKAGLQASSTSQFDALNLGLLGFNATTSTSTLATFGGQTFITASASAFNTSLGLNALPNISSGANNSAVGYQALTKNSSGSQNSALGYQALQNNLSGAANTAVGYLALQAATGNSNTAIGSNALLSNTGSNNVAVGSGAGQNATGNGGGNIFIGAFVGAPVAANSNQLNIGNILFGTGVYNVGSVSGAAVTNGNLGVGTSSPFAQLSVQAVNGSTNTTLFAIGSSTQSSTSTLFKIDNTGFVTIAPATTTSSASTTVGLEVQGDIVSKGTLWAAQGKLGGSDGWQDITYGNGLFVAVGRSGNRVATSPDGITWTARSAAGNDDNWRAVTYGNGLFVAVSDFNDRIMTSPDGINWTVRSAAGNNDSWYSVTYGNGLFVATGIGSSGDHVITSPDGITWTARSAAGNDDNWLAVTYGNGLFVAVGNSGDRVMTSPDGITWTARSAAGNDDNWIDIIYGNGLFVAVGNTGGSDKVITSPDGINWTVRSAGANNDNWGGVTYGNGLFVAVGNGAIAGHPVMTSPDGITWTFRSAAGNDDSWYKVAYGNGVFAAVSNAVAGSDFFMSSGKLDYVPFSANNIWQGDNFFTGNVAIGATSTPFANFTVFAGNTASTTPVNTNLFVIASSTALDKGASTSTLFVVTNTGQVKLGTTTNIGFVAMDKTYTTSSTGGINQYFKYSVSDGGVNFGNYTYIVNNPSTSADTLVGTMIKIEDNGSLANTVRGLEVQAHRGTNTAGENTAISGFGRTFGVKGTTEGDAGSVYTPAGLYGETRGTTQGNAIRAYSGSITSADALLMLLQDTSTFTGNGLLVDLASSSGTFTGNFANFRNAGVSKFIVKSDGSVGVATSTDIGGQSAYLNVIDVDSGKAGINVGNSSAANNTTAINFINSNGVVGTIKTNGSATAYNTSSDRRIKENIDYTTLGLDTLLALPVRQFSFIKDPTHATTTGFIAQELYKVFPDAVATNGDNGVDPLTGTSTPWAVDYGRITPLIVKGVQDLNGKVDANASSSVRIESGVVSFNTASSTASTTITIAQGSLIIATSSTSTPIITVSSGDATTSASVAVAGKLLLNGLDVGAALASTSGTTTQDALIAGPFANATQTIKDAIASAMNALGELARGGIRELGVAVHGGIGIFNSIISQTITATVINADTVNTKTLCIDGLCVSHDQLQNLLNGAPTASASTGGGASDSGASTPDTTDASTTDTGATDNASSTPAGDSTTSTSSDSTTASDTTTTSSSATDTSITDSSAAPSDSSSSSDSTTDASSTPQP